MKKLYSLLALSLFFCFGIQAQSYPLEVEAHQVHSTTEGLVELDGLTTYRIYVTGLGAIDFVSSIYGNNTSPFELSVPMGFSIQFTIPHGVLLEYHQCLSPHFQKWSMILMVQSV